MISSSVLGGKQMARVAALQKQLLLVHSCSLILSGGLLCQEAVWGQITHQQDIVWCPTVVLHFLEGPSLLQCRRLQTLLRSLFMQFNAQSCPALSELHMHWVCLLNQSPANPHDYRIGTLAHALSPWQSDTEFFFSPSASVFPPLLYYNWNEWFSVFEDPPCGDVHAALHTLCSYDGWIQSEIKHQVVAVRMRGENIKALHCFLVLGNHYKFYKLMQHWGDSVFKLRPIGLCWDWPYKKIQLLLGHRWFSIYNRVR